MTLREQEKGVTLTVSRKKHDNQTNSKLLAVGDTESPARRTSHQRYPIRTDRGGLMVLRRGDEPFFRLSRPRSQVFLGVKRGPMMLADALSKNPKFLDSEYQVSGTVYVRSSGE